MNNEDIGATVIREFNHLAGGRTTWDGHFEEVAQLVLPSYSGSFGQGGFTTPGAKKTQYQYDATAAIGLGRFSAFMESTLTPRNSKWHRLVAAEPELNKVREVQLFLEDVATLLFKYRYSPASNFSSQNYQNYMSLGAFGTGCMFVDELAERPGIRYRAIHLAEIYFAENHQGVIDKAYRRFSMTARQAVQKWGKDKLPRQIAEAAEKQPENLYYFIHCVKPRAEVDVTKADYRGMKWASYYVSELEKKVLSEGGYNTFPYAISRYSIAPGEIYGRSPAMEALPAIKTLNQQKKTLLKAAHRAVDPVYLLHDDGIIDAFSAKPGSMVAGGMSADGRPLVGTLPTGRVDIGKDLMDIEAAQINDAFLVSLFQILVESPQMTATEVLERTREKGMLLSPTMGRQQSEYLGPLIDRELDVLARQNLLPPIPDILREAGSGYDVMYDSPLSRAQRAEEASGLMRTVETALNIVNVTQNPEPLDHFDWDTIMPEVADIQAVPHRWMRDPNAVKAMREARAQAAQRQEMIQAAPATAAMMKAVKP